MFALPGLHLMGPTWSALEMSQHKSPVFWVFFFRNPPWKLFVRQSPYLREVRELGMTSVSRKIVFGAGWLHLERQIPDGEPKYIPERPCVHCRTQGGSLSQRAPGGVSGKEPTAG